MRTRPQALESDALGELFLGSSLGGIPELVIKDQTGQDFTANTASELASALEGMASKTDSEVAAMIGQKQISPRMRFRLLAM